MSSSQRWLMRRSFCSDRRLARSPAKSSSWTLDFTSPALSLHPGRFRRRIMFRQITSLALALALAFGIAACGGATASAPRTSGAAAMGSTEDATITARVKTVLLNDTQLNATRIDIVTSNGVVTMSGTVRSKAEEQRAIQLARQVSGVKDVKSSLQVNPGL